MESSKKQKKFDITQFEKLDVGGDVLKGGYSTLNVGGDGWPTVAGEALKVAAELLKKEQAPAPVTNTCTTNNCHSGNCVSGCGAPAPVA